MILYIRRVLCIFLTVVLLSAECSSIRINYQDAEIPKEEIIEYHEDSSSIEVERAENPPAPVLLKIQLSDDARDNLYSRIYSDDKLSRLLEKATQAKKREVRQASAPPLYPNLTPSPYQSHSVQYYNNSSPNSNSQYGQTNPYNQQWQSHNNTQKYPVNPSYPSYNPNTYGPAGFPNPYVKYNNSQSNINGPHPQNFPSINPGNYSNYPNNNPNLRPPNYPSNYPSFNPSLTPTFNPSQRPAYYQPGSYPMQNTSSHHPYYPNNTPSNPSYNPSQRPAYYRPGDHSPAMNTSSSYPYYPGGNSYPAMNTSSYYPHQPGHGYPAQNTSSNYYQPGGNSYPSSYPTQYNNSRPSYNPSQRPPYYPQNPQPSFEYNNQNTSTFTTPRPFQYPNTNPNSPNNPFYNPYPNGQNPAGFPTNYRPSNPSREFFNEDDLFKPVVPRVPTHAYDPNKSPAENFGY